MKPLTKAQITIGLLAFFASVWGIIVKQVNPNYTNIPDVVINVLIIFVSIMALAYVLLAILEWVKVFEDIKINALMTLIVIVTIVPSITI